MNDGAFGDEVLMAYADGELDAATAARVEAAAAEDPAVAARIEAFARTRTLVKDAAAIVADAAAPVPASLVEAVRAKVSAASRAEAEAEVVAFPDARSQARSRARSPSVWALPLAASIALVIGGAGGFFAGREGTGVANGPGVVAALGGGAWSDALDRLPAGAETGIDVGTLSVIGTFRTDAGELCREYRLAVDADEAFGGVACRGADAWQPRIVVRTADPNAAFAPASGDRAIEAYVDTIGGGTFLTPEEEAQALSDAP